MTDAGWIAVALVLGFLIGALVVWLINRKAAGPGHSVKALREESERFRDQVNDHFVETAELINQMTDSYKKVFDHLSDGAERLVDDKVIRERMPQVSDQEIRLKRIGQTSRRAESTESTAVPEEEETTAEKPDSGTASTSASPAKAESQQATGEGERSEGSERLDSETAADSASSDDKKVRSSGDASQSDDGSADQEATVDDQKQEDQQEDNQKKDEADPKGDASQQSSKASDKRPE